MSADESKPARASYALSSWLYGRALGIVLVCAFVSIAWQIPSLIGDGGLEPASDFVARVDASPEYGFFDFPSLAWISASTAALEWFCVLGLAASIFVAIGVLPRGSVIVAWACYLSIFNVGFPFTAFQWDLLLLEACVASVPILPLRLFDRPEHGRGPPLLARYAIYVLLAKLMLGSGIVKLASGDDAWSSLTALTYHYETQPIPTALGWVAHQLPRWFHGISCLGMFLVELAVPFVALVPHRLARMFAAACFVSLMALIGLTGNYGFFNLLAVVLCIPLVDDETWRAFAPRLRLREWKATELTPLFDLLRTIGAGAIVVVSLIAFCAGTFGGRFFDTLLSPIAGFQTFHSYGLFAVMTRYRPEIAIEGSADGVEWKEYTFEYKAGPLDRPPPFIGPHMPRLDWQMWFAALGDARRNRWLTRLQEQLLEGDPNDLFAGDPFEATPPRYVRLVYYDYTFTDPATLFATGRWWNRNEGAPGPVLEAARAR